MLAAIAQPFTTFPLNVKLLTLPTLKQLVLSTALLYSKVFCTTWVTPLSPEKMPTQPLGFVPTAPLASKTLFQK